MKNEYDTRAPKPEPDKAEALRSVAHTIATVFPEGAGFVLFAFDYGEQPNMVYLSNTARQDVVQLLKEFIARQE